MQQSNFTMRQGRAPDAPRLHDLHTASVRALCPGHYTSEVIDAWLANRRPETISRQSTVATSLSSKTIHTSLDLAKRSAG
jgi:hypothetical protein